MRTPEKKRTKRWSPQDAINNHAKPTVTANRMPPRKWQPALWGIARSCACLSKVLAAEPARLPGRLAFRRRADLVDREVRAFVFLFGRQPQAHDLLEDPVDDEPADQC